jgi:hypothetical protein
MVTLRWFVARGRLLWIFIKMIPEARALELEWQQHQQKRDDLEFGGPYQKEEFLYQKGICDGITYCMKRVSKWK